jgi:hypothetical protein
MIYDAEFLVDGAADCMTDYSNLACTPTTKTFGEHNPVEHIFKEIKRRIEQFYDTFSRGSADSVDA